MSVSSTNSYNKSSLIGIVAAYLPYKDIAVSAQTGRQRIVFEENSGLTIIYPVDYILEAIADADRKHTPEAKPIESN